MSFLDTSKIRAIDLLKQSYLYLSETYGMSDSVFVPSSPTGQILSVVANIAELIFLYLEHAASELNISRAQTVESVHGLSRLTGHDPYRGSAAEGMIKLKLNPSAITSDSSYVKILNNSQFTIQEANTSYFLNLDTDYITLALDSDPVNVEFVQGIRDEQSFLANGTKLQSYNVNTRGMTDHDRVEVEVDGKKWKKVDSLYDMNYEEECFLCKSSINMGLTIFFGNGNFGKIPESGKRITVHYINHTGVDGNYSGSNFSLNFNTYGLNERGEEVDLNEVLMVEVERPPMFGAYYEPMDLTRMLAPHQSKSFVLATPENYISFLSKYSQFAFVDAYNTKDDEHVEDDNVVYLRILPNIKDRISKRSTATDYFNLPLSEFTLSPAEKDSVIHLLDNSGQQLISTEVVVEDIVIKKYALVIAVKWFENEDVMKIYSAIRSKLNTYFLNINRQDLVPKSDIISLIENIEGVDSVNVFFLSEENEKAIRDGYYIEKFNYFNPNTHLYETIERRIDLEPGEDPGLGLDEFGDIVLKKNEVAVIKGGFMDREGVEFTEDLQPNTLCGLTILFTKRTEDSLYNLSQQAALNKILKS